MKVTRGTVEARVIAAKCYALVLLKMIEEAD